MVETRPSGFCMFCCVFSSLFWMLLLVSDCQVVLESKIWMEKMIFWKITWKFPQFWVSTDVHSWKFQFGRHKSKIAGYVRYEFLVYSKCSTISIFSRWCTLTNSSNCSNRSHEQLRETEVGNFELINNVDQTRILLNEKHWTRFFHRAFR